MTMNLDRSFYKRLLKSDLDLHTRSNFADIVNSIARSSNPELWNDISSHKSKFSSSLHSLRERGYVSIESSLFTDLASEIYAYCSKANFLVPSYQNKSILYLEDILSFDSVRNIVSSKDLRYFVSLYLGAPATLYNVGSWIQYPSHNQKAPNTQLWHRDRDDFSFLKLFMNVSNVDINSGPHAYIPGSHQYSKLSDVFSSQDPSHQAIQNGSNHQFLTDAQLHALGLRVKPKVWTGSSSMTFLEDTRGFHRAYTPVSAPRLMFTITWVVGPGFDPQITL